MTDIFSNGSGKAVRVAVYATLVYDIISATNSSPQTTEINAKARAETLMKWVKLGMVQAGIFAVIGVALDEDRWPPILGSGLAGTMLWLQYRHALESGLASNKPGTENLPVEVTNIEPVYRGKAQLVSRGR